MDDLASAAAFRLTDAAQTILTRLEADSFYERALKIVQEAIRQATSRAASGAGPCSDEVTNEP